MNRTLLRQLYRISLVASTWLVLESVSFADTSAPPRSSAGIRAAASPQEPTGESSASGREPLLSPAQSERGRVDWRNVLDPSKAHALARMLESALARARVCHISRHPRDGLRASEHACPLLFADVMSVVSEIADGVSVASDSRAVLLASG